MAKALSIESVVREARSGRAYESYLTKFFGAPATLGAGPQGFLVEMTTPNGVIRPHFHRVNQFQVVMQGGGRVGKHPVEPVGVHYTDGFTPYGPIVASDAGITFYTLRAEADPGAQYMPGARDKMERRARRGITVGAGIAEGHPGPTVNAPEVETRLSQPDGLAGITVRLPANGTATGPDPATGGGQYYIVVNGSLIWDGAPLPPRSLIFVDVGEAAPQLAAGPDGAEVLVVQFPRPETPADQAG